MHHWCVVPSSHLIFQHKLSDPFRIILSVSHAYISELTLTSHKPSVSSALIQRPQTQFSPHRRLENLDWKLFGSGLANMGPESIQYWRQAVHAATGVCGDITKSNPSFTLRLRDGSEKQISQGKARMAHAGGIEIVHTAPSRYDIAPQKPRLRAYKTSLQQAETSEVRLPQQVFRILRRGETEAAFEPVVVPMEDFEVEASFPMITGLPGLTDSPTKSSKSSSSASATTISAVTSYIHVESSASNKMLGTAVMCSSEKQSPKAVASNRSKSRNAPFRKAQNWKTKKNVHRDLNKNWRSKD